MEELYDLVDENNNPLGLTKPKSQVHRDGDWHRAVHVWIVNQNKEVLVQKRTPTKTLSPNLWDLSMGGHISAGEEPVHAAMRELKEELGMEVNPEDLKYVLLSKDNVVLTNGIERLFHNVYIVRTDWSISRFVKDPEEVAEIKYISVDEMENQINSHPEQWMVHNPEYSKMFEYIRTNL